MQVGTLSEYCEILCTAMSKLETEPQASSSSHGDGREIKQIVRLTPSSISCSRLLLRVEVNMRCHPLSQLIQLPGIQSSGHTRVSVTHNHTTLTSYTHQTIFTIITTDTTLTTQTSNITTNNPRSSILTINNLMF